jgi:replicative DNA helicase
MSNQKSYQAEIAVLGCLLHQSGLIDDVIGDLKPDDFDDHYNRQLYTWLIEMRHQQLTIDLITVSDYAASKSKDDNHMVNIAQIMMGNGVPANLRAYADLVKEESNKRKVLIVLNHTMTKIKNNESGFIEFLKTGISKIENERISEVMTYDNLFDKSVVGIEEHQATGGGIIGLSTGFPDLDGYVCGLRPGNLIILGARPSMGKTILMMNIADNIAIHQRKSVVVFSLEMPEMDICKRTIARLGKINGEKIFNANLSETEWASIAIVSKQIEGANLFINDKASISVFEMRSFCRKVKNQYGLDAIFIDYLGLIGGLVEIKTETHRLAAITRELKAIAKDFNVPVFCLCQLNRDSARRENKTPMLADLRDSGAIEQDADLVIFLDREEVWKKTTTRINEADVIVAKNRNGKIGNIILTACLEMFEFRNHAHGRTGTNSGDYRKREETKTHRSHYSEPERD